VLEDEVTETFVMTEGVDRGGALCRTVPLVRGMPLTTRGGVGLGVTVMGVEYVEFTLRLYEVVVPLLGPGEVARLKSLGKCVSSSPVIGAVCARCI
jgi:hypothetical protein